MKTIKDLLKRLAIRELSNTAISESKNIVKAAHDQVIDAANESLTALYSRFILLEKGLLIEMREGITNYHLSPKYAYSSYDKENPPPEWCLPYIHDLHCERFTGDVVKVLSLYDSLGRSIPLNDENAPWSVFTPNPTVIQIPRQLPCQALSVNYQAKHPTLVATNLNQVIHIPDVLWVAFTSYIGSEIYAAINTQEAKQTSDRLRSKYEAECKMVIDRDLVNSSTSTTNSRFDNGGWV